ncbi:MAG TPA: hypothetical protein VLM79_31060 [Kofleriaceae bacterium]|nr:hypothetical protein [Kofleriaceae bacterium]
MRLFGLTALAALAACRFGFDPRVQSDAAVTPEPDAATDATPPLPPDAPPVLSCAPARFTVDSGTAYLTAVGTPRGFDVFTVDSALVVHGYAFKFVGDRLELVAGTGGALPVPSSIGPVAAVALDPDTGDTAEVAIAVPYPMTARNLAMDAAVGTVVVPLDAQLQPAAPVASATMNDGLIVGPGALAGGDHGRIAYLAKDSDGFLAMQAVSRRGVVTAGTLPVNTNAHTVTRQTLVRAASGYLGVWSDNSSAPHEAIIAAPIDDNLVARAPVTISVDDFHGSFVPGAAYLPTAHRYLFGWMVKTDHDFLHLSMRDDQLANAPGEIDLLGAEGTVPIIAAGDTDFLAVWPDTSTSPTLLRAARVDAAGKPTFINPMNTLHEFVAFDVIAHHNQTVLFWVDKNGTGPNLWIDPLCSP